MVQFLDKMLVFKTKHTFLGISQQLIPKTVSQNYFCTKYFQLGVVRKKPHS